MATLYLTLKRSAYQVMVSGEKQEEFRRNSNWIKSRLERKNKEPIKYIKFTNGYKKNSPHFLAEYLDWEIVDKVDKTYSNGLHVKGENLIQINFKRNYI